MKLSLMPKFFSLLMVLILGSHLARAEACIVPIKSTSLSASSGGHRDRLKTIRHARQIRNQKQKIYLAEVKKSSCHRAFSIARSCHTGRDNMDLKVYKAALEVCDQDLKATATKTYRDEKKRKLELDVVYAARTGCNEEFDDELDKLLCYMGQAAQQIHRMDPKRQEYKESEGGHS